MNTNTITNTITDWILRVGDGENFINSSKYKIWGIQSTNSFGKYFIKHVKIGDRLWFVKSKTNGKLLAVSTYNSNNMRELGPLININMTDDELGWTKNGLNGIVILKYIILIYII